MTASPDTLPTICMSESRESAEPGLRLFIHSLFQYSPSARLILYWPFGDAIFAKWLSSYPNVTHRKQPVAGDYESYGVKPFALLALLDEGHPDVLWCDSDLIITSALHSALGGPPEDAIVVAEEALVANHGDDNGLRARLWGFEVGRVLPFTLNTVVLRVTRAHRPVLERWKDLLASPEYRAAQRLEVRPGDGDGRPLHMLGDQEVLTALLASIQFSHHPIHYLRRGRDIIQFFGPYGYTVAERMHHLVSGMPPFVHAMGQKPWLPAPKAKTAWEAFYQFYAAVSPYTAMARGHSAALACRLWLRPPNLASRIITWLGFGQPALIGLPLALVADSIRLARYLKRRYYDKHE